MTMKFGFADDVDVAGLQAGTEMHMQLSKQPDGRALVTGIHVMSSASKDKTEEHVDDHSTHDMAH